MVAIKNPMLLEIPDSFQSERLIIRAPRAGDGVVVNEAVRESLEHLKPWMPWADHEPTVDESEESVRRGAARWILREDLWLLLFRKSDGLYVGGSGLHRMNWNIPGFEIGYWVRKSLEGQGYVTEAVKAITEIAFLALSAERVEIRCDTHNERSAAVAKRAGYTLEATLRHDGRDTSGELRDSYIFGMTHEQYLVNKLSIVQSKLNRPKPAAEVPILPTLPGSFETERLLIRAPRLGDGQALNEAIHESRERLLPWLSWAVHPQTPDETENIIRTAVVQWQRREDLWMLMFRKSDGLCLGRTGLHQLNWTTRCFEIGYWVRTSAEGQGYVREAVAGVTEYAFTTLGAARVEIRCDSRNERSSRTAQQAGYTLEGTLRQNVLSTDETELRDTRVFAMLRDEWQAKRGHTHA